MADRGIIRLVLEDWNYWDRPVPASRTGHERDLTERILEVATGKEVVAITGIRRCGKSTILYQIMDRLIRQGIPQRSVLLVNLEDHRLALQLSPDLLEEVVATWRQSVWPVGPGFILLDEVQEVPQWERWVRTLNDLHPELRVVVTGSNSSLMAGELATLLTGRNLTFQAAPLSFREYLRFRGLDVAMQPGPHAAFFEHRNRENEILHYLEEHLEVGGYPEAVLADTPERRHALLQQYFADILAKDVAFRYQVRETRPMRDLALLLLRQLASPVSAGKLAQALGTSRSWVLRVMGHLEESSLLNQCRHFSFSMRQSMAVQKPRKVYVADLGLRNAVCPSLTPDRGHLAENLLYQHLRLQGLEPTFWSGRREVDFVLGPPDLAAVNLTWSDDIAPRELEGLLEFQAAHNAERILLATRSRWQPAEAGKPAMVPLWAVLLSSSP